MQSVRVAILGAGSVRCSVPVIGSLATHFGERPLDVILYDADEERLDLFDRFARLCFLMMKSSHSLRATSNLEEALEGADRVVIQMDSNCLLREASTSEGIARRLKEQLLPETPILDLEETRMNLNRPVAVARGWPARTDHNHPYRIPFQVLRWLNGEEYPFDLFREVEHSALKLWLDDPNALPSFRIGSRATS